MVVELGLGRETKLWSAYAEAGYSKSGHIGFRAFVAATVQGSRVTGTTRDGLTIKFSKEEDATLFALQWL